MGKFSDALRAEISGYANTEWNGTIGGLEVTIQSQPLTPNDMQRIARKHPNFTQAPTMEGMVDLLIQKAMDANGDKAFDMTDKPLLMRTGTNKIGEIFAALFASQLVEENDEAFEDRRGN